MTNRPTWYQDVRAFHRRFDLPVRERPVPSCSRDALNRVNMMVGELVEYMSAVMTSDLEGQADALLDLIYFAVGTAVQQGLPLDTLWQEVHRANMDKTPGGPGARGKQTMLKPPGWVPPQLVPIITAATHLGVKVVNDRVDVKETT